MTCEPIGWPQAVEMIALIAAVTTVVVVYLLHRGE